MMENGTPRVHWKNKRGAQIAPLQLLPVALLFPWISMVMVATLLPEAGAVTLHKLQAVEPLGALVEVELGHNQPHRATMLGVQVLTIMLDGNQHIVIIKISQRHIGRVARP